MFLGYALYGGIWKGDVLIEDLEELETKDASEIYSKRVNAKKVIFPKEKGEFIFPIADGPIKTPGGDQDLRTSTLVRHRPIQGEGHIDFLGESEGSLPQPQDSFPDAGEAINDFWSMSGSFIYRHHVETLDRFHTICSIGRNTSRRIYVVPEEIDEKTAYIQARSSMARALEVSGKARQAEGEAKVVE